MLSPSVWAMTAQPPPQLTSSSSSLLRLVSLMVLPHQENGLPMTLWPTATHGMSPSQLRSHLESMLSVTRSLLSTVPETQMELNPTHNVSTLRLPDPELSPPQVFQPASSTLLPTQVSSSTSTPLSVPRM